MTAYVTGISDDVTAATYAAASCVYRSRGGGASGLVSWPAAPRSRDPLNRLFFSVAFSCLLCAYFIQLFMSCVRVPCIAIQEPKRPEQGGR